ncbi:guanine nucleotide-binding protein G(s) subunit alpha isoforms XLas-like [Triticum dicoccoides]|uniref:guanine nucleotide-binding protein G(s) subunit alpha isoforms XLas-like n=1 Tax=Triticum dicoccoides TaxID=85692 RepID=UPI00188F3F9F|nr:guanine nucleotide-binding protein G(s) subunit alpha isoforms XLas-like [Triticum dicoccoides]
MSGSYSSRLRAGGGGGGLGATTVLAAKVAFASAALAAAACMVPQLVSGADAFLWKLYLFVTVHVIIFVIWKLSDSKHFHAAQQQHKDPWAPSPLHHPAAAAPPLMTEQAVLAAVRRKVEFAPAPAVVSAAPAEVYRVPPPVSPWHEAADSAVVEEVVSPVSCGGESCVTTESEEDASSAAASAYIATADASRSVSPARERAVLERGISLPPRKATAPTDQHFDGADNNHDGGGGDDDDLDATWNAIMQKTRPATAPAASTTSPPAPRSSPPRPSPSPRPRAREPSVGAAELSKRSEDFIKKIHNSFGRHQ